MPMIVQLHDLVQLEYNVPHLELYCFPIYHLSVYLSVLGSNQHRGEQAIIS